MAKPSSDPYDQEIWYYLDRDFVTERRSEYRRRVTEWLTDDLLKLHDSRPHNARELRLCRTAWPRIPPRRPAPS